MGRSGFSASSVSCRAQGWPAGGSVVGGGGDLQHPADRLDPELVLVGVDVAGHLGRRPSSSAAKKADALLRISLARRSSRFSAPARRYSDAPCCARRSTCELLFRGPRLDELPRRIHLHLRGRRLNRRSAGTRRRGSGRRCLQHRVPAGGRAARRAASMRLALAGR
jgi:hypothetical protein